MWKKCKVIMLPTDKAMWPNCLWIGRMSGVLRIDKSYDSIKISNPRDDSMLCQHLYILSNDEIKKGDWFINRQYMIEKNNIPEYALWQHNGEIEPNCEPMKVIATTDYSLNFSSYSLNFPSIPLLFIEKYVSEYKRNKIKEVMVEYENSPIAKFNEIIGSKLMAKISSDNTINIKLAKTSWTREEMIENCWKAYRAADTIFSDERALRIEFNNWIRNNL